MPEHAPYETPAQARAAAHAVIAPEPGSTVLSASQNRQLLGRALQAAGVTMGRYGDRMVEWLGSLEDAMVAEVARWITDAARPPEGTVTEWGIRAPLDPDVYATPDEAEARRIAGHYWDARVVSHQVTPWTEVPAPETVKEDDDG